MKKQISRKAQAESIIIFFFLCIGIFVASIIVLRLVNVIVSPFQAQIGNYSAPAGAAVGYVHTRFTATWDYVIVFFFFLNIILLFASSFLIDIHPAFILIYIVCIMFLFVLGNSGLYVLDAMWDAFGTSTETGQTPLQQFIINNFNIIMLGIVILSGIITYAKFKFTNGGTQY